MSAFSALAILWSRWALPSHEVRSNGSGCPRGAGPVPGGISSLEAFVPYHGPAMRRLGRHDDALVAGLP